jgi:hypothetical protein
VLNETPKMSDSALVQEFKHFICSSTDIQIAKHVTNFEELHMI